MSVTHIAAGADATSEPTVSGNGAKWMNISTECLVGVGMTRDEIDLSKLDLPELIDLLHEIADEIKLRCMEQAE